MSILKGKIFKNLKLIDALYQAHQGDQILLFFYSKLSLMELCGWIEISMESLAQKATKNVKLQGNIDYINNNIIGKNHGFSYDHFRKILIQSIGIKKIEVLEAKLDKKLNLKFKSTLSILKKRRDNEAHSYIEGIQKNIDAPSRILKYFENDVFPGLKDVEHNLSKVIRK